MSNLYFRGRLRTASSNGGGGGSGAIANVGGAWLIEGRYYGANNISGAPVSNAVYSEYLMSAGGFTAGRHAWLDEIWAGASTAIATASIDAGVYLLDTSGTGTMLAHAEISLATAGFHSAPISAEVYAGDQIWLVSKLVSPTATSANVYANSSNVIASNELGFPLPSDLGAIGMWMESGYQTSDLLPETLTFSAGTPPTGMMYVPRTFVGVSNTAPA